jgi:hypothetical protein
MFPVLAVSFGFTGGWALDASASGFAAIPLGVFWVVLHSPLKSAHSSHVVPLEKVHTPYSEPSGFFRIFEVPPTFSQFTDAGFAIPVLACDPFAAPVVGTVVGTVVVTFAWVATGVVAGVGVVCVQPEIRVHARRQPIHTAASRGIDNR